jgi:hypothetical protein
MIEALQIAAVVLAVFLLLLGIIIPFLPSRRDIAITTTTVAELERVKREVERRFWDEAKEQDEEWRRR